MADAPQRAYTGRYEIDITASSSGAPGIELIQTLHWYVECQCGCGHWTCAKLGHCAGEAGWAVELTEWHLVGPGLVSLIYALNLRLRCSRARIREFLRGWFELELCTATINKCIHEAERALRHWVIARCVSYGTRTEQGSRAFALTISMIDTCRKRDASPWPYLAEVSRQWAKVCPPLHSRGPAV